MTIPILGLIIIRNGAERSESEMTYSLIGISRKKFEKFPTEGIENLREPTEKSTRPILMKFFLKGT